MTSQTTRTGNSYYKNRYSFYHRKAFFGFFIFTTEKTRIGSNFDSGRTVVLDQKATRLLKSFKVPSRERSNGNSRMVNKFQV